MPNVGGHKPQSDATSLVSSKRSRAPVGYEGAFPTGVGSFARECDVVGTSDLREPSVESVVFVIDDDASVRASLKSLSNRSVYMSSCMARPTNFLIASAMMPLPA